MTLNVRTIQEGRRRKTEKEIFLSLSHRSTQSPQQQPTRFMHDWCVRFPRWLVGPLPPCACLLRCATRRYHCRVSPPRVYDPSCLRARVPGPRAPFSNPLPAFPSSSVRVSHSSPATSVTSDATRILREAPALLAPIPFEQRAWNFRLPPEHALHLRSSYPITCPLIRISAAVGGVTARAAGPVVSASRIKPYATGSTPGKATNIETSF